MLYYLLAIIIIILILDQCRPRQLVRLHKQLGIDWMYLPIIGHGYKFIGNSEDLYKLCKRILPQHYKRKDGIISLWVGFKLVVGIADPIQAVSVLRKAFNKNYFNRFISHLLGNGIIFAPSEIWYRRRKILVPTFATRHVSKFISVFETNSKIVADQLRPKVGNGNFSCHKSICQYGLDSVCETILGVKLNALSQLDQPFSEAFQEYIKNISLRAFNPLLHNYTLYQLMPVNKRQIHTKKIIYDFIDNVIHEKINQISANKGEKKLQDSEYFKTFLELMIESSKENDKGYTYEELREESLSLVLAGTDTTALAICFTMLLLSQYQDVQEKVYQEVLEVLGDTDRPIEFQNLQNLKYVEGVIKETLRLYPPVPVISRDSEKERVLPSGLIIPKNCEFIINIMGIHHNPYYWGEDAEHFKPERFLSGTPQTPGSFMAFSYGPRNCIGQLFVMLSIKTTLVTILRRYRLLPATSFKYDKDNPLRISIEIMIKHVDNFDMQIEYRNQTKVSEN